MANTPKELRKFVFQFASPVFRKYRGSVCHALKTMYTHPVLHALDALDRSSEQYQEQRVKIINKYTHTIDPVIDVVGLLLRPSLLVSR